MDKASKRMENRQRGQNLDSRAIGILMLVLIAAIVLITPKGIIHDAKITGKVSAVVRILGVFPPYFGYEIGNYSVNQTGNFTLRINCSDDDPYYVLTYYDNFSGLDINETSGVINQSGFDQAYVGNNTIQVTCKDDVGYNASQNFNLEIIDINEAPLLGSIGNQVAVEGVNFILYLYATDPDYNNPYLGSLSFGSQTTMFSVATLNNSATNGRGLINFTPTLSHIGNTTINITVFDGYLYDYEVIMLTVARGAYCGDGSCAGTETCENCESDCGACPEPPPGEIGEPPEQTEAPPPGAAPMQRCNERWECSVWESCSIQGIRARRCIDANSCGTTKKKPGEVELCIYVPTCFDGIRNGREEGLDCGGPCPPCLTANCFDGIKNCHDGKCEEDVDCGGPCALCKEEEKQPITEQPIIIGISRFFPWLLLIIIAIILASIITADRIYERNLRKKSLDDYREKMRKYRPLQRKIYKFVIDTAAIALTACLYIYYFSDSPERMAAYMWLPISIALILPFAVSAGMRHYAYYEYKKRMKEQRLKERHKREMLQLIRVENGVLLKMEGTARKKIYDAARSHILEASPAFYSIINKTYSLLRSLSEKRSERYEKAKISGEIFDNILSSVSDRGLLDASRVYPEFRSILECLKYIEDNRDTDTADKEEELMQDMKEISCPYMRSVISAKAELVRVYNLLVGIYNYYAKKQKELIGIDEKINDEERAFTDTLKEASKKASIIDSIQGSAELVSIYNFHVELFNHYSKKIELNKVLKQD